MKFLCKGVILFGAWCVSISALAAEFTLPDYQKVALDNGLTVYLMEQHEVPLISVQVTVKAGAVQDDLAGQAQMTASSLLLGTEQLSRQEFEQKLDAVGASIDAQGELEGSVITASFLNRDSQLVMGLLADAVLSPGFDTQEFTDMKARHQAQLEQQKESPRAVIGDYFKQLLFAKHPYAHAVQGDTTSIGKMTLDDVKRYYQTWYQPNNASLAIVGDFDSAQMLKQVKALFAGWSGSAPTFRVSAEIAKPEQANVLLVNKSDALESTFLIGGVGIARSHPDFVPLTVINTILGGRFTSWLNDELRVNAGLTYGARSRFSTYLQGGSFVISTFTRTATTQDAIDLALETYQRLWKKGIDQATLDSAKAYVKGQFPPRYEQSDSLASLLGDMYLYGFNESFINRFSEQVNSLDIETAQKLIDQHMPKQALQFVIVGKADEIRSIAKGYGKLKEVEISND